MLNKILNIGFIVACGMLSIGYLQEGNKILTITFLLFAVSGILGMFQEKKDKEIRELELKIARRRTKVEIMQILQDEARAYEKDRSYNSALAMNKAIGKIYEDKKLKNYIENGDDL